MAPPDEGAAPPGEGQNKTLSPTYKDEKKYQAYQPPRDNNALAYSPTQQQQKEIRNNNGYGQDNRPAPNAGGDVPPPPPKKDGIRERSRTRAHRKGSGQIRICKKCGEPLTGQFVRALDGTFHLDCFKCADCGEIVASKFFPVGEEGVGDGQYPLCETDYFRRLDLLCHQCGGALRGSYITALDRKYHIDHFTCSVCPTVFSATDSYYEHEGQVYCHYHYSTQFAQRCNGCQTAILKQFVEIFRNGMNQHWHPECYMIHKFWNVRLADVSDVNVERLALTDASDEDARNVVRVEEEKMEEKVFHIWSVLSHFEESSAANISDMLLHVSNGAYVDGVMTAMRFIWHIDLLFKSADNLDDNMAKAGIKGLSYTREAKLLCKKIVAFFTLLSKTQETGVRRLGVTQELLSLVTGLAHYLKLLIRICLQGALRLEREAKVRAGLDQFLEDVRGVELIRDDDKSLSLEDAGSSALSDVSSDQCTLCQTAIDDECAKHGDKKFHHACLVCVNCNRDMSKQLDDARWDESKRVIICQECEPGYPGAVPGFVRVTRLQQYVFLLKVALARLLLILKESGTLPHTSDNPNLNGYDSQEGHRVGDSGAHPAILRSDSRSKSYGGVVDEHPQESSYERTLNDVRRLRSTRMDKHLSSTIRKARTSRIMDAPQGEATSAGDSPQLARSKSNQLRILEDRDDAGEAKSELVFGHQDALTLDDIPRIVAAEQAREQRPNAYKHTRHDLFRTSITEPKLINGHQRSVSSNRDLNVANLAPRPKKYFAELSALEYFIVRHVAVLSLQPLLEGYFTLEELLGLIESRKPTFWGKFGNAFKNDKNKKVKKKGVFGVPLEQVIEKDGVDSTAGVGPQPLRIPAIVDDCIKAMRQMDLSVEGVFRKNGNMKRLKEAAALVDKEGSEALDLSKENVVQVAALLKKYFRDMPDPLLTYKLYNLWYSTSKLNDPEQKRAIHLICCLLPKAHRDCLEILCTFLIWAASFAEVDEEAGSKMDDHNLATVIAPNIFRDREKMPGVDESFKIVEVVHLLIRYNEEYCEVPQDLLSILNDTSLFNNSSEITTKEILKRYGDIAANGGPRHTVESSITSKPQRSKDSSGRAQHAPVVRVDTDPTQQSAMQTDVRHVQEPSQQGHGGGGHGGANSPSAPHWRGDEFEHISPYSQTGYPSREQLPFAQREGGMTPDSFSADGAGAGGAAAGGAPRGWRNSGWGPGQGQGLQRQNGAGGYGGGPVGGAGVGVGGQSK